jgi:hypothetical protein
MPTSSAVQVIGYRWESSGGSKACAQCRAMHGKEFYFEPHGSQRHVDEMPSEQLHPNCRCRRRSITAVRRPMNDEWVGDDTFGGRPGTTAQEQEPPPGKGLWRDPILGAVWRKDNVLKGPVYGNYGGLDWTGGKDEGDSDSTSDRKPKPINQMDEYFAAHDEGYTQCRTSSNPGDCRIRKDEEMVRGLSDLPKKPEEWRTSQRMTDADIAYAKKYRSWALWHFKGRIDTHNQNKRDREEWGTNE